MSARPKIIASAAPEGKVYVPRESLATEHNGIPVMLVKGVTRIREGHALLRNNPDAFVEARSSVDYEV